MSLTGTALLTAASARGAALHAAARHPRLVQERTLRRLVRKGAQTAFGRVHGLGRVRSVRDYRERVPVRRYWDLEPWLRRALAGEADVTWPGRIRYFGMSSGTTAGNKYLPVSRDSIRQQQRGGFDPVAAYLRWSRDTSLMDGKAIMLGGSSKLSRHDSGALIGDNTGIMANHMPRLVQHKYRPSPKVRAVEDWDLKIELLVRECMDEDVRLVAGTPSWFPGLFDRLLEEARHQGRRAGSVYDLWPNLRLITGGGIGYEPYRPLIEGRLGKRVPYVDVYNATEGGIMGVQEDPRDPSMTLLVDNGVYYELVPLADIEHEQPTRLSVWEADVDRVYALVVTTMSGLWSYAIGDTIRFTSLFPHRFVFEGRTAAFLNVTGEHVSQGELERAVRHSAVAVGTTIADFTVTAEIGVEGQAARHVFWIEVDGAVPDLARFAARVDEDLSSRNDDYVAHRSSRMGLLPPLVRTVPRGTFHEWMRRRGKLGGQNKVPRVIQDAEAVAELEAAVAARAPEPDGTGANGRSRVLAVARA